MVQLKPKKPKRPFVRLKKRERAVAIANDVLRQLKVMRIQAGTYLSGHARIPISESTNPQEFAGVLQKKCHVCAIGACVISHIKLFDKVKLHQVIYGTNFPLTEDVKNRAVQFSMTPSIIRNYLAEHFRKTDVLLMECAFERAYTFRGPEKFGTGPHVRADFEDAQAAERFGNRYEDHSERLAAIMRNIVKNKGHFVIPKEFYYEEPT